MSEFAVEVENVGGIDSLKFESEASLLLVSGPNSTNKTSLLQAIAFGLGADHVPIRSSADEARVTLRANGKTVTRTARRRSRGVDISGKSWLSDTEDRELVGRFASLLEFNPIRVAVRQDSDFEEILKSPIDLDDLERRRAEKIEQKRDLQRTIESLEDVEKELARREDELESKRDRVEELETKLASLREQQSESGTTDDEFEELRERRGDLISDREACSTRIEDIESAIERLETQRSELDEEIDAATETVHDYDTESLKRERETIQTELAQLEDRLDVLQSVLTANREMLRSDFTGILGQETGLLEDTVHCWACGSAVNEDEIRKTQKELERLIEADKRERAEYRPELNAIGEKIAEAESARKRLSELESERQRVDQKIEERQASLETNRDRLETLQAEIEELDAEIETQERERSEEVTDLTDEIEQTRVSLFSAQNDVERLERQADELREDRDRRAELETSVEELSAEITELTDTIENQETELRTEFNEGMEELLDVLEFDRIARVWLDGGFQLTITREVDGRMRQDSIQHLSESEREMVGLVLALAGYVTYDLPETVPFLLLDTLNAFDTDRTQRLIEYFDGQADYLLAAVLSEVAEEMDCEVIRPGLLVEG